MSSLASFRVTRVVNAVATGRILDPKIAGSQFSAPRQPACWQPNGWINPKNILLTQSGNCVNCGNCQATPSFRSSRIFRSGRGTKRPRQSKGAMGISR
jgi:hypothetical protein